MHFLARDEAKLLEKELRRQIADQPRPKLVLYYNSGDRDYSDAAALITASEGLTLAGHGERFGATENGVARPTAIALPVVVGFRTFFNEL